jgi:hypothetical protein
MEHVRIHTADGKPVFIDQAPAVLQMDAGSIRPGPESIPGDVESSLSVTDLEERCRNQGVRANPACTGSITVEQKYMSVLSSTAAVCTARTGKTDIPDNICQILEWIGLKKGFFSLKPGLFPGQIGISHGSYA